MYNIDLNNKKKCVYSLYSYFDVPNAGKESITNSMFKITLNVHAPTMYSYISILAVPDPALLGFDYFLIYNILIIAIPDS